MSRASGQAVPPLLNRDGLSVQLVSGAVEHRLVTCSRNEALAGHEMHREDRAAAAYALARSAI